MIGISTIDANAAGAVVIDEDPAPLLAGTARVQRTKTLDGSAVLSLYGYTDGDRTLTMKCKIGQTAADVLWGIFTLGDLVTVSTDKGCFRAAIESLEIDNGAINMSVVLGAALHE